MMKPYRILSLDGGGTWALLQVMALQQIYSKETPGHQVLRDFDLVAATSGGSITAGGLVTNLPLSRVLDYFCDETSRKLIFSPLPLALDPEKGKPLRYLFNRFVRRVARIGAKYGTIEKRSGLTSVLTRAGVYVTHNNRMPTDPNISLAEVPAMIEENLAPGEKSPEFLICGFNYDRKRAKFFRSNTESQCNGWPREPERASLCDAIHASTNAPVNYFVAPAEVRGTHYWDGAIAGLNNPVLAAVTEALANGVEPERIQVLSLGTGTVGRPPRTAENPSEAECLLQAAPTSTLFGDVEELATSILDDPPDTATFISQVILNAKGVTGDGNDPMRYPVVRMTPVIRGMRGSPAEAWRLPADFDEKTFKKLADLDMDATEQDDVDLLKRLGDAWIKGTMLNQAIREDNVFACRLGHRTFGEALEHWRRLRALNAVGVPQVAAFAG